MKAIILAVSFIATNGGITPQQALRIVQRDVFRNDPKIALSRYSYPNDSAFYFFEASWDNPNGSMIAGHFAVNSRTATLWNLQGSVCGVLTSAKLTELQQSLRRGLRIDAPTFAKLSAKHPIVCHDIDRTRDAKAY